ncbi:hypothetical protein GCM10010191_63680 [Actinomadura vinacea]|uniref:Plectin n=1 Tax=Actinomadura vinacea TaxID=115336 RepID=A0ABN3JTI3_9ACTN
MPLGRRMSKDVAEALEADRVLAENYRDRLGEATAAEAALRAVQEADSTDAGGRAEAVAFDRALTAALEAALAAERVAAGPKVYAPAAADAGTRRAAEIAFRRAKARPAVQPWTDEVDRLRTVREAHRLSFRDVPAVAG